jgi:hypothetical protein
MIDNWCIEPESPQPKSCTYCRGRKFQPVIIYKRLKNGDTKITDEGWVCVKCDASFGLKP